MVHDQYKGSGEVTIRKGGILAAMDHQGFVAWETTPGTYNRELFHEAFQDKIVPLLNPWRSIVVMDNAKIHMYRELQDAIHQTGARLIFNTIGSNIE